MSVSIGTTSSTDAEGAEVEPVSFRVALVLRHVTDGLRVIVQPVGLFKLRGRRPPTACESRRT